MIAAFAIDEEGTSAGTHHLVENLSVDAALVLEPVGIGNACVAHLGFGSLDLVVRAAAAHGLQDAATDAGVQMARLIEGLARLDREVLAPNPHPLVAKAFFHTAWLRGGTDYGTYPAGLTLGFEVRVMLDNDPFEAAGHEQLLDAFSAATQEVADRPATPMGFGIWTDAAIMQAAGIPTLLAGGDGGRLHAVDGWADLSFLDRSGACGGGHGTALPGVTTCLWGRFGLRKRRAAPEEPEVADPSTPFE